MLTQEQVDDLRDMGVHRYNHNLEAARSYFPQVVTTHSYEERWDTCLMVHASGMELCCGGLVGMGETLEQRAELAAQLAELEPHEVPLNFLNPRPGTPFGDLPIMDANDALRTIAAFRLAMPRTILRYAGGRELTLGDLGTRDGLLGGINAVIVGNYLTTLGRDPDEDLALLGSSRCRSRNSSRRCERGGACRGRHAGGTSARAGGPGVLRALRAGRALGRPRRVRSGPRARAAAVLPPVPAPDGCRSPPGLDARPASSTAPWSSPPGPDHAQLGLGRFGPRRPPMPRSRARARRVIAPVEAGRRSAAACARRSTTAQASSRTFRPESCQFSVSGPVAGGGEDVPGGVGEGVGGDVVVAGDADGDLLQRSQGLDDLLDAHAGRVLQVAGDGQGGEHDGQVGLDRVAGVVRTSAGRAGRSWTSGTTARRATGRGSWR